MVAKEEVRSERIGREGCENKKSTNKSKLAGECVSGKQEKAGERATA